MGSSQVTSMPVRERPSVQGILDRAYLSLVRWDGEKLAWVVLLVVALLSRTIGLGDRAMSHDESLHAVYSWKLYDGQGYQHQPMMHGPLKFVLDAFMYFLFGANDWSARIQVALFGVLMVGLVWLLRPYLGRLGAFLAALMYTISPALLFHSRYIRDEVMLTTLLVALAVCLFRYRETRATKWLVWTAVVMGLAFTTMEASFIFGGLFGIFLLLSLAAQLWTLEWPTVQRRGWFWAWAWLLVPVWVQVWPATRRRGLYRTLASVGLAISFVAVLLLALKQPGMGLAVAVVGLAFIAWTVGLVVWHWWGRLREFPELDLIVLLLSLVLPYLSAVVLKLLGWQISQYTTPNAITPAMVSQGGIVLLVLALVSVALGWLWLRNRWFMAAGPFWALELLLFTTFLTNGQGIGTGLIGSLGYWIDQQEVMRGGQPWYYFFLMVPLYEFLPLLLAAAGGVAWVFGRPGAENGRMGEWEKGRMGERESGGKISHSPTLPLSHSPTLPLWPTRSLFISFLVYWSLMTWATFTYVGEKMPWHVVYFTTPMALLGGWWLGRLLEGIDWGRVKARGGWWLVGLVPVFLVVVKALLPVAARRPFVNTTVDGLSNTAQWLLALVVGLVVVYLGWQRIERLGWGQSRRLIVLALAGLLGLATVGVAYRLAYVDYDYATEPLVYAHATPDIKLAMSQIAEISRATRRDHALRVAYDDDSTWPLEWYLRDYNNRVYYGATPTRDAMDSPVVIAGDKNLSKVRPYLGDRYYEFSYRLIWWPTQTYFGLTWQRLWDGIRDPVQRGQFWNVVLYRKYTTPTTDWSLVHRFSVFVRKDVAAQVWDWATPGSGTAAAAAAAEDPYAKGQREIAAVQQLGTAGTAGSAPGQLNQPRAVAVGADGRVYVADSGNNRIVVYSAQGQELRSWGSTCKLLDQQQGCQGDGRGQFNEPWGIAVGKDGSVYVADTWNHRIQKFDGQGQFVSMWGTFESTGGELGQPNALYGPRSIVVGRDGNVYVMDTGNKRVQAFTAEGQFVAQYGGAGVVDGRFDEPVGLAQDGAGNWYVADTWSHRIQKFDSQWQYVGQWAVAGWGSQGVTNKPYLAVDGQRGLVYATDPEGYRVLAFGLDGSFKATWGLYGNDAKSFTLPTGIAVGADGRVYVADGDADRIMIFPPLAAQ